MNTGSLTVDFPDPVLPTIPIFSCAFYGSAVRLNHATMIQYILTIFTFKSFNTKSSSGR